MNLKASHINIIEMKTYFPEKKKNPMYMSIYKLMV